MENIYTVFITALTVLGSGAAFRFYEKRMDKRREDEFEFKYDCRDRIAKLEALLQESSREKDEMRKTILELSTKVAELVTKIQYLENKK
jgi:hypothetical protein